MPLWAFDNPHYHFFQWNGMNTQLLKHLTNTTPTRFKSLFPTILFNIHVLPGSSEPTIIEPTIKDATTGRTGSKESGGKPRFLGSNS
jgi:hypothetical protein